ncbi:phage holin family protein [Paracoccus sp. (in: a-proteobacteria)]
MFDYARNLKLAAQDTGRRVAIKAAAGGAVMLGAGFLLAALWTFLARTLGWGPLVASLLIGVVFVGAGIALLASSHEVKHPVPTTDELKAEIETRLELATDAALEKARLKATEVVDTVENRVHSVVDEVAHKANRFADSAEARVQGFASSLTGQAGKAAEKVGLTPQRVARAEARVKSGAERFRHSNAATIPPLVGAFAVGIALANRLQSWRHRDDAGTEDDSAWDRDWEEQWDDPYGNPYPPDEPYDDGDRYA